MVGRAHIWLVGLAALGLLATRLSGQSTQGMLTGRVTDSIDGEPLNAQLTLYSQQSGRALASRTNESGSYVFALLSPGVYRVEASAPNYQGRVWGEIVIPVAGIVELNLEMRPAADVWEKGLGRGILPQGGRGVVSFVGPDIDSSGFSATRLVRPREGGFETASSDVIDSRMLQSLPLSGRDAYTMLVLLAQTSSDAGTARGLGISARGQRPSAAGFLLDGVENNNDLVTGPSTILPPEALQEYRVSTGNFTAEFGRTSGLLANAVTASGGSSWRGILYAYGTNEALNARGAGEARKLPFKQVQSGISASGPLIRTRLFASGSTEYFRSHSLGEAQEFLLPGANYARNLNANGWGTKLLARYSAPYRPVRDVVAPATIQPPSSTHRWLTLGRLDYVSADARSRQMMRVLRNEVTRPDFIWTPYKDFVSPLMQGATGFAFADVREYLPGRTNETRLSIGADNLNWDRKHPEIPTLVSDDGTVLPGSPAFYGFKNAVHRLELVDNAAWVRGTHHIRLGGSILFRRIRTSLLPGRDGRYTFSGIFDFANADPSYIEALVVRRNLPVIELPGGDRRFQNRQWAAFVQDTWRPNARWVINVGARYEFFGTPVSVRGEPDTRVMLGTGNSIAERIAAARLVTTTTGGRSVYDSDRNNWAGRLGVSARLDRRARTFFRANYGVFYDRPFDNPWQNTTLNGMALLKATATIPNRNVASLESLSSALSRLPVLASPFPEPVLYQRGIRDAYVHSYFGGIRHQLSDSGTIELNFAGSLGRKLLTTDKLNRLYSFDGAEGRWNPQLPTLSYRSNQGTSSYNGLSLVVRRNSGPLQGQVAYTWSHSIDLQSEPLSGDVFDLSFINSKFEDARPGTAAFSRQLSPGGDRGSSDFDQRHSLVAWGVWDLPRKVQSLRLATLAAFRSGFPFTVFAPNYNAPGIYNRRADLLRPKPYFGQSEPLWINPFAFGMPADGQQGTLGRNALRGPGFFNFDVSASRAFSLRTRRERETFVLRADIFNLFNHANLQTPDPYLVSETFGQSKRGRTGRGGFPSLTPFRETGRVIQFMLQVRF